MFRPGTKFPMLNLVRAKYGWISAESTNQMLITSIEEGMKILHHLYSARLMGSAEYKKDLLAIERYGLCQTEMEFYQMFARYKVDKKSVRPWQFTFCSCNIVPLVHGMAGILNETRSKQILTLGRGFGFIHGLLGKDEMAPQEGILLMQQMVAARLAIDDDAWMRKFASLPDKDQLAFYRTLPSPDLFTVAEHDEEEISDDDPQVLLQPRGVH